MYTNCVAYTYCLHLLPARATGAWLSLHCCLLLVAGCLLACALAHGHGQQVLLKVVREASGNQRDVHLASVPAAATQQDAHVSWAAPSHSTLHACCLAAEPKTDGQNWLPNGMSGNNVDEASASH